jgi:type I restriction enzyme S subunit
MSLPKYPDYHDSGVEWLGDVPSHWKVVRLKSMVSLVTEKASHRSRPVALENIESWSGRFIATDGEFEGEGVAFREGDILFGKLRPYLAKAYLAESRGEAVGDFHVLRASQNIEARFLQYGILNRTFIDIIDGSTFGSKMPRASWEALGGMPLVVPSKVEQSAIAAFLDRETAKIDALIAEQEKLIALLAEKRQATISHAVTKGLDPDAPMKDSGVPWLGAVPAHWEVVPLKYLVALRSGGTPSKDNLDYWNGDVPWASAKDLKVEALSDTSSRISQQALVDGAASLVPTGAVLVVVRGMILARIFPVVETLVPMAINQDLKAVLPRDGLDAGYLAWLLRGSAAESLQRLDEAGHGTKALRMDAWTSMQLPAPSYSEQKRIANFLAQQTKAIDALSSEAVRAISLLQQRRSALIAAAVTGQIDVRGLAA